MGRQHNNLLKHPQHHLHQLVFIVTIINIAIALLEAVYHYYES